MFQIVQLFRTDTLFHVSCDSLTGRTIISLLAISVVLGCGGCGCVLGHVWGYIL